MGCFSVSRNNSGQAVVSLRNVEDMHIKNLGTATGDMDFSMGATEDGGCTVLQVTQSDSRGDLDFTAAATQNGFQFNGTNIDAKINQDLDVAYNVEWNANNSSFDSTKSGASVLFSATDESYSSLIKVGDSLSVDDNARDNYIFDAGKNNTYIADTTSSNLFQTLESSSGVIIQAGSGTNEYLVGGSDGVYSGGSGTDIFNTSAASASGNILMGNAGADHIEDHGTGTLFLGGPGKDSADMQGAYSIANLGFDEQAGQIHYDGSSYSTVFTGESAKDAKGNVYTYADVMASRGWTVQEFLENSEVVNNPYYSLIQNQVQQELVEDRDKKPSVYDAPICG